MAHTNRARSRHLPRPQSLQTPPCKPSQAYNRRNDLPCILPLWPHELDDETPQGRRRIVAKLRRALRAERRRGNAGHWTYDLARHVELLRVYRLELASSRGLQEIMRGERKQCWHVRR